MIKEEICLYSTQIISNFSCTYLEFTWVVTFKVSTDFSVGRPPGQEQNDAYNHQQPSKQEGESNTAEIEKR